MEKKTACIIGAGPAGLTAALELLEQTDIKPVILEATEAIGGLSQTVHYKGNCIDIGAHRYFSKSERVMNFWLRLLPLAKEDTPRGQERLMLKRKRLSRILFLRKLFSYPLSLDGLLLRQLGLRRTVAIAGSYLLSRLRPRRPEASLEDFFINHFGKVLYQLFFKDYTYKVWGVPCAELPSSWGAQRVKGVSVRTVLSHALKRKFRAAGEQRHTEVSLIEWFLYPQYGPGQLWEAAAEEVSQRGGIIYKEARVVAVEQKEQSITGVVVEDSSGRRKRISCDYLLSSMPVKELIQSLQGDAVPPKVARTAEGLVYRDFITVGMLIPKEKCRSLADNWIYIQEKDVLVGRIQIFNNWSPALVADPAMMWLGLEYFCNEGDALWQKPDEAMTDLAGQELVQLGFIPDAAAVSDAVVMRMPKAYPAYLGSYENFHHIRDYVDAINNLFLIGRNGMHRYNNMDHSMLTAIAAVENIAAGRETKDAVWTVNTEAVYHEEAKS